MPLFKLSGFLAFPAMIWFADPCSAAANETPDKIMMPVDEGKSILEMDAKMGLPEKATVLQRFKDYTRGKTEITLAEFQAIYIGSPTSHPRLQNPLPTQTGKPPADALDLEQVKLRFKAQVSYNKLAGKDKTTAEAYMKRAEMQAQPGATWFTYEQVDNALKFEYLEPTNDKQRQELAEETAKFNALDIAEGKVLETEEARHQGIQTPRIRRSWRDVLYDEDPTQADRETKKIGDLEGAIFSYAHNGIADADTWNAHGALILPITYNYHTGTDFSLRRLALAPSVTYDRVTTNGNPSAEVDTLFYRAGIYMDFYGLDLRADGPDELPTGDGPVPTALGYGLQVRAAGVFVTDHDHDAELGGYEADLEPRFHFGNVGLGYRVNLMSKTAARKDKKDDSYLEAQLRTWLHIEGGDVQNAGQVWTQVDGSFFRLGPTAQFTLTAPALPGDRALSLTVLYSYLAAVSGADDHPSYFRATLAYDLLRDVGMNRKIGLALSYEQGGQAFTKQDLDALTLGLNILF